MKKKYIIITVMLACFMAWHVAYPSGNWHYKMTVTVDTPEGIKTGSAVREIHAYSHPPMLGVSRDTFVEVENGEAVVVDLGVRGVLFALMSTGGGGGYAELIPFEAFSSPCSGAPLSKCNIKYFSSLGKTEKVVLSPFKYPEIVHFKDLRSPLSVERIIKMGVCAGPEYVSAEIHCVKYNRFEEIFGEGVALKSIELEVTEENTTEAVYNYLPWLSKEIRYIDGQTSSNSTALSNVLQKSDFVIGD